MKLVFCATVLYMFYKSVYGERHGGIFSLEVDHIDRMKVNAQQGIGCKSNRNQKVEWLDPSGNIVTSSHSNRIFVKDHFTKSNKNLNRIPEKVLYFNHAAVKDSGVWQCRSGELVQNVPVCIIDFLEFFDTPKEISMDVGRAISISCQVRGEPEPKITWYKDGELIAGDDDSTKYKVMKKYENHGIEGFITIVDLKPEDGGVYTCVGEQENPLVEKCSNIDRWNITLNVNRGPALDTGNGGAYFAHTNESVSFNCSASGFPLPTYKWFRDLGDVLSEIPDKEIVTSEDGQHSSYSLIANESTFGTKYKCRASNIYGDAYFNYTLFKLVKPSRPSGVYVADSSGHHIELNVTFDENHEEFPTDSADIQYFVKRPGDNTPGDREWARAKEVSADLSAVRTDEIGDVYVSLFDLEPETEYWLRLRLRNDAGESPWSSASLASTIEDNTLPLKDVPDVSLIFYAFLGTGLLVVIIAACMFIIKKI